METIFGNNKKYWEKIKTRGPHPSHEGGGAPAPLGSPPYIMGPLELLQPQLQLYIFAFGEKKQREEFIAFYDTEPPPSPKASREG